MYNSIFISDLHGKISLYEKLFDYLRINKPNILFIGGDLLPAGNGYYKGSINNQQNFLTEYLIVQFRKLKIEVVKSDKMT